MWLKAVVSKRNTTVYWNTRYIPLRDKTSLVSKQKKLFYIAFKIVFECSH